MNFTTLGRMAVLTLLSAAVAFGAAAQSYVPAPENLAARQWFQDAKFGMFIHWGVYSVLARGEWTLERNNMTLEEYEKLPAQFNPVKFDAAEWVSLAKQAGMKYITITSKHHDGFAMFDSKLTDWDIVDATPYGKDVLKMLADECAKQDIKLFFYHSHLDWHSPDYYPRGRTGNKVGRPDSGNFDKYLEFMNGQLAELLSGRYGKVAGIWFDGWWDQGLKRLGQPDAPATATQVDWKLDETYSMIHKLQPAALIGNNHHVTPFPGEDFQMFERDLPGENKAGHSADSEISALPLETCTTMNGAWGYNESDKKFKSVKEMVHLLVRAAGHNANLLLNVGPMPTGEIQPEFVSGLKEIGEWTAVNGEAIYGTRGGAIAPAAWGVSTQKGGTLYIHVLEWPQGALSITAPDLRLEDAELLGGGTLKAEALGDTWTFEVPEKDRNDIDTIIKVRTGK